MIRLADYYLEPVHKMMKAELLQSHHVHCDETPFIIPEHSKEYMWVFHSPEGPASSPIFLYEYIKPYEYFTYLLKELIKYPRENIPEEELKKLMPWSEVLPDSCRKNKTR